MMAAYIEFDAHKDAAVQDAACFLERQREFGEIFICELSWTWLKTECMSDVNETFERSFRRLRMALV